MDQRVQAVRGTALGPGVEFDMIREILRAAGATAASDERVRIGPGDDAGVLEDGTVVSIDVAVENVHFRRDWLQPEEIGYRAAAAALGDLAAMAASAVGVLAAVALPADEAGELAPRIMSGIVEACRAAEAVLLGGDIARSPAHIVIDIAVIGRSDTPVTRAGARPGDELWVTGELGAAAAAVRAWQNGGTPTADARRAFARPPLRIAAARQLARSVPLHALIDVSDGVAGDAAHLAAASGVRIVIDRDAVPIAAAVHVVCSSAEDALQLALGGGEDYELLLAAEAGALEPLQEQLAAELGVRLTRIGRVEAGQGVMLRCTDGAVTPIGTAGYNHFLPPT